MDIMDGLVYLLGENSMYFKKCKNKKEKPELDWILCLKSQRGGRKLMKPFNRIKTCMK